MPARFECIILLKREKNGSVLQAAASAGHSPRTTHVHASEPSERASHQTRVRAAGPRATPQGCASRWDPESRHAAGRSAALQGAGAGGPPMACNRRFAPNQTSRSRPARPCIKRAVRGAPVAGACHSTPSSSAATASTVPRSARTAAPPDSTRTRALCSAEYDLNLTSWPARATRAFMRRRRHRRRARRAALHRAAFRASAAARVR